MGWKIIDIERECYLKIFFDNLIVIRDKKISIPIADIDTIIISNNRINISINLLNELCSKGVNVIFCDNKFVPRSCVVGFNVKKQSHKIFLNQLKWTDDFKFECWKIILIKKILNQINLLKKYGLETNNWENILEFKDIVNDNTESQVANLFFHSLYGKEFNRDLDCEINYILNYGYTILTSMVTRSIIKKGLNQHISFFHGSEYSQFPLAYDIVEPFRIIVDFFVKELFDKEYISMKDKFLSKQLKECFLDYLANFKIKIDDKYQYLNNAVDTYVDWIIKDELNLHDFKINLDGEII